MNVSFRAEVEELDDGMRVISVFGELDQATLPDLEQAFDEVINGTSAALLVDLTDCAFIDSSGLGALVSARDRLLAAGDRRFGLCCPGSQVQRLLEVTGLDTAMGIVATREEAIDALRRDGGPARSSDEL